MSSEYGTCKTVKARFLPWLSAKFLKSFELLFRARKRLAQDLLTVEQIRADLIYSLPKFCNLHHELQTRTLKPETPNPNPETLIPQP